jgi:monofunctional biosynthetic peptidoglycan transglycosylase
MVRAVSKRRAKERGWGGRIFGWLVRALFIFVIGSILWVLLYRFVPPPLTFTMAGDMVGGRGVTKDWLSLDETDPDMARAAIAGEDARFCSHGGFDAEAIAAAIARNVQRKGVLRGGSTISQQTAKNAFLWQGGGYFRKGLEAWFTLLIEQMWGKRRIMEVYLNIAETGIGTYGANAGAERYFGKDASNLSRSEAARIAAVLPLPKKREAKTPTGFTRRYGNSIAARIGVVQREGLDACLYEYGAPPANAAEEPTPKEVKRKREQRPAPPPPPEESVPGEEFEQPATEPEPAPEELAPEPELNGL